MKNILKNDSETTRNFKHFKKVKQTKIFTERLTYEIIETFTQKQFKFIKFTLFFFYH